MSKFNSVLFVFIFSISVSAFGTEAPKMHSEKIGPLLRKALSSPAPERRRNDGELMKVILVMESPSRSEIPCYFLDEIEQKIQEIGGRTGGRAYNKIQAWCPVSEIEALAEWEDIRLIRKPLSPGISAVASEGTEVMNVDEWRPEGLTGEGVKVGVIDMGFGGYGNLLGTELPDFVETHVTGLYYEFSAEDHGTACAEIIHDTAPEARLFLANAGDWDVDFHNAVDWLLSQDVQVISSSIGINYSIITEMIYELVNGSLFSSYYASIQLEYIDELKAQWETTIQNAVGRGVTWVQAAGNEGEKRWKDTFVDTDGDQFLNFSVQENGNEIVLPDLFFFGIPVYVLIAWGEGTSTDDFDLYITDNWGNVVALSIINQAEFPDFSMEVCAFNPVPGQRYFAEIHNYDAEPQVISLNIGTYGFANFKYLDPKGTVKMSPPADLAEVITVGAVDFLYPFTIETYSSQGPNANDVIKPDVVAPDFVSTRTYGEEGFPGTSAAAPHAAGVCALIKQLYPDLSPVEVKNVLETITIDLGAPGKDNVFGSGLIRLPDLNPSCIPVTDSLDLNLTVNYMGTGCIFTLNFFDDPDGIFWKMDTDTARIEDSAPPDAVWVGADLDIPVCAEYQGIRYTFVLKYAVRSDDPQGLYWEMDVGTFREL